MLSVIWMSDLTDKMKCSFFQAAVVSILLYGCTTSTLTERLEKRLDGNYTRMLWAILNKSWRHHPTKQQLYSQLPPIMKNIKVRRTRHAGHCWRSRDKLIRDVLLWTPSHGRAKAGRPARTYMQQLCEDTGCSPGNLPKETIGRGGERKLLETKLRGAFNKFPDFFCMGVRNCCRILEIQYVIAIHFMRWPTNFYDFKFKWTATATTKAWLSQLVDFKNAIWYFRKTICNKILF